MTRLRNARLKHHFWLDRDDDLLALPFCHHRGCQRISDYVGGGPAHVQELIDTNDQKESGLGQVEAYQRRCNDHQRSSWNARHTLAGHHEKEKHRNLLPQAELDVVRLRDEQCRESTVHHRAIQVERIAHRQDEADNLFAYWKFFELLHHFWISRFAARG